MSTISFICKTQQLSSTSDHFLSPRAPSAAKLEIDNKNLAAKSALAADAMRFTEKLELLRLARERTDQDKIAKRVDERVAAQRAKLKESETKDLAQLSSEEATKVDSALSSADATVLTSGFNVELCGRDIKTLAPAQWLNDEVINFYLQLLKERDNQRATFPRFVTGRVCAF